jgi:hypothetical protein
MSIYGTLKTIIKAVPKIIIKKLDLLDMICKNICVVGT